MFTSMWFMSLITLLVVDVRIRALQHKDGLLYRCQHCTTNTTGCAASMVTITECAGDRPLCATSAVSPNFTSELTCAAATKSPCSLTRTADTFAFICSCADDLCNTQFSKETQKQLLEFISSNLTKTNSSDFTETFFNLHFGNVSEENIYKTVTVEAAHTTEKPVPIMPRLTTDAVAPNTHTTISHSVEVSLPRAEAFKHEPTALSEDDEDASEGSGAYEETRTHRQPASDPADPSSFLPASENKAPSLVTAFIVTTPVLICILA